MEMPSIVPKATEMSYAGHMHWENSYFRLYTPDFVERNFDRLRQAAIQDLARYISGWSIYSISFLNAVAELQGVDARLGSDVVPALRKGAKRIRNPLLVELIEKAPDARSMKIREIMDLIAAEAASQSECD